jgi:hypothetical protein
MSGLSSRCTSTVLKWELSSRPAKMTCKEQFGHEEFRGHEFCISPLQSLLLESRKSPTNSSRVAIGWLQRCHRRHQRRSTLPHALHPAAAERGHLTVDGGGGASPRIFFPVLAVFLLFHSWANSSSIWPLLDRSSSGVGWSIVASIDLTHIESDGLIVASIDHDQL